MSKPIPVLIAFGWSRDETSLLSNAIRYLTRPGLSPFGPWAKWSHMFLVFTMSDGSTVIHEALMSQGWCEKPAKKLSDWLQEDPEHHVAELHWLPIDAPVVEAIYAASCAWLGTKSYARRQLLAFALAESVLGRWLGLSIESGASEVICSEGAGRQVGELAPEWDLRRTPDQSWDSVSPQGAYEEYLKIEGAT